MLGSGLLIRFRHCFPNEVITGIRLDGNELAAMRFTQRWIEGLKKLLTTSTPSRWK